MLPRYMENDDWDEILYAIRRDECVVVLGPGAGIDAAGKQLQADLCQQIAQRLNVDYQESHDILFSLSDQLMQQKGGRNALAKQMMTTYSGAAPNQIHHELAQLPISLYISSSPDVMLKTAMEQARFQFNFSYFHPKETIAVTEAPKPEKPLVYNLFGCIHQEDSWVLTHDHLFEFLFSMLGVRSIPELVFDTILKAKTFIFLGFDFESWYLKLMLRKFKLHEKEKIPSSYAFSLPNLKPGTLNFYSQKFNLTFVNNTASEIKHFVHELFTQCLSEPDINPLIRKPPTTPIIPPKDKLRDLVKDNQLEMVFQELENECRGKSNYTTLILIHRQYLEWRTDQQKGTKSAIQLRLELNQLVEQLLDFISTL